MSTPTDIIAELIEAVEAIVPMIPPRDAMCHKGIVPQERCSHCQRVKRVHDALNKAHAAGLAP